MTSKLSLVFVTLSLCYPAFGQYQIPGPMVFYDDFRDEPSVEYIELTSAIPDNEPALFDRSGERLVVRNKDVSIPSLTLLGPTQSFLTRLSYEPYPGPSPDGMTLHFSGQEGQIDFFAVGFFPEVDSVFFQKGREPLAEGSVGLDLTSDTNVRFDITDIVVEGSEGTRLQLWAWQGDVTPTSPLLEFETPERISHPRYPGFGVWLDGKATFDFIGIASIPEPENWLNAVAAGLCLMALRARGQTRRLSERRRNTPKLRSQT